MQIKDNNTFKSTLENIIKYKKRFNNNNNQIYFDIKNLSTIPPVIKDVNRYMFNNIIYVGEYKELKSKKFSTELDMDINFNNDVIAPILTEHIQYLFNTFDTTTFINIVYADVDFSKNIQNNFYEYNNIIGMYIVKF